MHFKEKLRIERQLCKFLDFLILDQNMIKFKLNKSNKSNPG